MSWRSVHMPALKLAAAGVTLGLFACDPGNQLVIARPECPTHIIVLPSDTGYVAVDELAAPGPISLVPEYHDCQRFMNAERTQYGPLIAIFATHRLDTVPDPSPPLQPTRGPGAGTERAAATILNYNDAYVPLRIEKGINCLYMVSASGVWRAHIVKVMTDSACVRSMSTNPGGAELQVSVLPGPRGDSVPPVARWDWDSVVGKHYIGIRCGSQWCEVFDKSQVALNSSPRYDGPLEVGVKGWYDEQYLAVPAGPDLVPGAALGTIFPAADLEANVEADFDKTWKQVAVVSLSAASPKYEDRFNFILGPAPMGRSIISLCKGDVKACLPPSATVNQCDQLGDPWWAKIVSGTTTRYRCVIRRQHPGVSIPGAARWRWQVDDEDMWIRCPTGCCHVT